MGIVNNQSVFIAPPLGEGESTTLTSFREDDDFSTDLFDESIVLPSFPNNVGIAFVRSSDSPADFATLALKGTNTSTLYADNTSSNLTFAASGDVYIGYRASNTAGNVPVLNVNSFANGDLYVKGFIYGNFNNVRLRGRTRFGLNTIEINEDDNSISGVGIITATVGVMTSIVGISSIQGDNLEIDGVNIINANVGIITSISGITTITPVTELNVNGGLIVSGVSTVGVASTSNLTEDSTLTFELVDDTTLAVKVRGSDGVIRSANLILS
jgi:hypothetical protein